MGMATSKVRLNICGSSYVVNTSESEDYMQNLADRLNLDMNELMASSNSVSITTAAVMTALNYRDELEKASGSADNMRRQIKDYLEDAASAKMAAEVTANCPVWPMPCAPWPKPGPMPSFRMIWLRPSW